MIITEKKTSSKSPSKKTCVFPDLTTFEIESVSEVQETRKVSYLHDGIRQTIWLPKEFISQSL